MKTITLGQSDLQVTSIGLGTMTFGEQVGQDDAHALLSYSVERGINLIDTAEMYAVPPKAETCGATETIIGHWLARNPGMRQRIVLATKVAGPSRGMPWIRAGQGLTPQDIVTSCEGSLRRLQTDVIDLYQIHWPERHVPIFGMTQYEPKQERSQTSIEAQLQALAGLVRAGKVRYIGLSNETPYGVHEFVRLAEQHGLPRIVSVQNAYHLLNRSHENALDETCHRLNVGLLAYSPLAFGLLTGKYDASGLTGEGAPAAARLTRYESTRKQRWGRPEALDAARKYNQLARDFGLTPVQLALSYCAQQWRVASTLIGITSRQQLEDNIAAFDIAPSAELIQRIDALRWQYRDPAI